jgi:glycosyltransferase involved in cell wall biosynthesis
MAHTLQGERLDEGIILHSLGEYGTSTLAWRIAQRIKRCQYAYSFARHSKAELFHYYSPEFIPWAKMLRNGTRRPMLFDCMEDFEAYCYQRGGIPDGLRKRLASVVRRLMQTAAQNSDAVIVADEGTAELFKSYACRVVVVHNFPELALFPERLSQKQEEPSYDIVYHGSVPQYHWEACLAIDRALVELGYALRWRLIGNVSKKDSFLRELEIRRIAHRFHVSGLIPHDRIAEEVRKAKLGLIPLPPLPKFNRNIPQKLFEFMALGMPVVLSDLPPSRPFVGDGACAISVAPDDYDAYAAAIVTLLKVPSLCEKMGTEGRRRVKEQYNWERESRKLVGLYDEFLN